MSSYHNFSTISQEKMYTNWAHYYIPKVNGVCSFLVNPLFIFIIFNDKKLQLGNYRYLLFYFAIFNMTCSICDILVPMLVHDHRYAFSVFTFEGYFVKSSNLNQLIISIRCGFISATYAILHAHFVYRFMVIFTNKFLAKYFLPYGMILSIIYCLFHMIYWVIVCYFFIGADRERKLYMRDSIKEVYGLDSMDLNMIVALYQEGSYDAIHKSLIGIFAITFLSVDSVLIYLILGILIIKKLNSDALIMSKRTKKLQRQLMKALIVQSIIPTVVSFAPCICSWYQPIFGIELGRAVYHSATIAVSGFPFFDPLAILFFVPSFRQKIQELMKGVLMIRQTAPSTRTTDIYTTNRT